MSYHQEIRSTDLLELARDLAKNYFDTSISLPKRKDYKEVFAGNFDEKRRVTRNLMVVGAGASYSAYKPLLNAEKAAEKIWDNLGTNTFSSKNDPKNGNPALKQIAEKFLNEEEKLKVLYSSGDTLDFESKMELLSKFFPLKEIRNQIQKIYNRRYYPDTTYEIIAHLLKHRFIDSVINFNFDELLDQAIEEEMKGTEYRHIISDGHCGEFDELVFGNKLKVPIHIKPHGTASHKSTLKFTKADYLNLPYDMANFLRDLIGGRLKKEGKKDKIRMANVLEDNIPENQSDNLKIERVNILIIGFRMQSVEFNNIIKDALERNNDLEIALYFFNPSISAENNIRAFFTRSDNNNLADRVFVNSTTDIPELKDKMVRLWDEVCLQYNPLYQPRKIDRNSIVGEVFKKVRLEDIERDKNTWIYAFIRTVIEVTIYIFLHKGRVNLSHLINSRVGIYYDLYVRSHLLEWKKAVNNGEVEDKAFTPISLYYLVESFGLVRDDYFDRDFYKFPVSARTPEETSQKFKNKQFHEIAKKVRECAKNNLMNLLKRAAEPFDLKKLDCSHYLDLINELLEDEFRIKFYSLYRNIFETSSYDVCPRFSEKWFHLFDKHFPDKVLHTRLAWKREFNRITENEQWSGALMSSERGTILLRDFYYRNIKDKNRFFRMLLTDNRFKHDEDTEIGDCIRYVPDWEMVHHMSIFFQKKQTNKSYIRLSDLSLEKEISQHSIDFNLLNFVNEKGEGVNLEVDYFDSNKIDSFNNRKHFIEIESGIIPSDAIYFHLNKHINEACPMLITSQLSNTEGQDTNSVFSELVWDSDLVYLTKMFYKYSERSANTLGDSVIKTKEPHSEIEFVKWIETFLKEPNK